MGFFSKFKSTLGKSSKDVHGQDGLEWIQGGGLAPVIDEDTKFLKAAEIVAGLDGHAMRLARDRGIIAITMTMFAAFSVFGWYMQAQKSQVVAALVPVDQVGNLGEVKVIDGFTPTSAMMNVIVRQYIESCFTRYSDDNANFKQRERCRNYSLGPQAVQPIADWIKTYEALDFARLVRVTKTVQVTGEPNVWNASWQEEGYDGKTAKAKSCKVHDGTFTLSFQKAKSFEELAKNPSMIYIIKVTEGYNGESPGPCNW